LSESLKDGVIRGLKWSSVSQLIRQILQYISTIILVGILSPDDFGIIAMALVVINFLDIFKDLGTSSALIQNQNLSNHLKSSIFWVNCTFGIIISIIIYFLSPLISLLFNSDKITSVLQVLSLIFLITGLSLTQKALLERSLSFKTLTNIELVSSALGFIAALYFAFTGFGVWSLVAQVLTFTIINTLLLWIFSSWKPSFYFKINDFKSIASYSLNLVGFNLINYVARNSDYFLIAKFLNEKSLGHYYLAYRIMLYPLQNISSVISRVIFPSFSILQNDNARLSQAYLRLTNLIVLITFPMMAGMAIVSYEFTSAFFGSKWDTNLIALLITILAPVGAIQSLMSTVGIIYQVKGKTDWMFRWGVFATSLTVIGFLLGLKWGVIGISVSYLVLNIILFYPSFSIPFKLIGLSTQSFLKTFANTLFSVAIMIFMLIMLSLIINNSFSSLAKLVTLIPFGILVYGVVSYFVNREIYSEIKLFLPFLFKSRSN
jgi:O-antigen/teichoic acid export membrane protein